MTQDQIIESVLAFTQADGASEDAFNGLALAIVRADPEKSGRIVLHAHSPGLGAAQLVITSR